MENVIIILVLALIAGLIVWYLVSQKRKGRKCIGCPHCNSCNGCCDKQ